MKKQLLKKLSAFIITAMMFSASANAQIVYTDVIPDSTMLDNFPIGLNTKNYNLDLDNNANDDFILTAYYGPSIWGGNSQHGICQSIKRQCSKRYFDYR